MASRACCSIDVRIEEMPAAQSFLSALTIASAAFLRVVHVVVQMCCHAVDQRASRALPSVRQHFLKLDAVFLDVLVYSGCSAFRFPSARSD
jgi:hypothetical protein